MGRRYRKDLRGVSPESKEYWDELLRREGLTMEAGRNKRLTYVGNSKDLEGIQSRVIAGTEKPPETLKS